MRGESTKYSRYFTYIKPLTKIPIIKTYGSTIFTLIVITIFIFFAVKPTIETILVLQKKLDNAKQVLKKVESKTVDLATAKDNYDNLKREDKDKIEGAIPSQADLKSLIKTLEQVARDHDASISALQIQPITLETKAEDKLGSIAEIEFSFNLEGVYQNLLSLLQDLRSSSRLISIDKLSINRVSEGSGLIMSMTGKAYYIK